MVETRRIYSMVGLALLAVAFLLSAAPAIAQDPEQGVNVRILASDGGERFDVADVAVTVFDSEGNVVGEGITGEDGSVRIPLDTPAIYTVEIDAATLPEDVNFPDPESVIREANVQNGRFTPVVYQMVVGEGGGDSGGVSITGRRVMQLTTEGIKLGLFLAMAAIGLSLIFGTTGLVNFAHAELVTWGMLVAYFFNVLGLSSLVAFTSGWPWFLGGPTDLFTATLLAMALGAAAGWALDHFVFANLRRRGTGLIAQMVIAIGIGIAVRYSFLFIFAGTGRFFRSFAAQSAMQIGPVVVTPKDLVAMIVAVVALVGVGLILQFTRAGRAMRAVSDNKDLAESSGINVEKVIRWVWMGGAALAALGGVLLGQSDVIRWDSGSNVLLLLFAGIVLGGLGTAYGALVGCLVVGLGIQLSTLWIPAELRNVGALTLMVVFLLIRPQGILGRKERIG